MDEKSDPNLKQYEYWYCTVYTVYEEYYIYAYTLMYLYVLS